MIRLVFESLSLNVALELNAPALAAIAVCLLTILLFRRRYWQPRALQNAASIEASERRNE